MADHIVAEESEIGEGERILIELEGRFVGVYKIDGEYYAYTDWCPHQSGPVCEGRLKGTTCTTFDRETLETTQEWVKEDEVIQCPWHAWEFDVFTGDALHDERISLISHPVTVENGDVVVSL